jgi:uncharacterized BrkB/YihY/UPF0761 family membrane protein
MTQLKRRVEPAVRLAQAGLPGRILGRLIEVVAAGSGRPAPSARASIGLLGVILAVLTATSFVRALQRSFELAWRLPPAGCAPPGARWPWSSA